MSRGAGGKIAVLVAAIFTGCGRDDAVTTGPVAPIAAVTELADDVGPPNAPVIFLHYDYMVRESSGPIEVDTTKKFGPDPDAVRMVVEAFRRRGITLVIDPEHTEIPYSTWISFVPGSNRCPLSNGFQALAANFWELKEKYFRPKGNLPWHYAIFGQKGCLFANEVSGAAELPGYDFMVTVNRPTLQCLNVRGVDLCKLRQAGTFMHELGHNLGLNHGGDEDENYKPNYVSVMNYLFQGGIAYTAAGDTHQFSPYWVRALAEDLDHIAGVRLDYSSGTLPAIDELHVDEQIGLGGPAGNTDITTSVVSTTVCGDYTQYKYIRVAAGPLDWNQNGIIESDVAVDANWLWTTYFSERTSWPFLCPQFNAGADGHPLRDFDDWTHVQAFLRTPQYVAGTLRPTRIVGDSQPRGREHFPQP
jgi:hypothetical protein